MNSFFIGCSCFRKFFISIWILCIKIFYFFQQILNLFIFLLNFILIGLVWFCKGFYFIVKFFRVILILFFFFFFLFKCFHHHANYFVFLMHDICRIFRSMKNMEETLKVIDICTSVLIKFIFNFFLLICDLFSVFA